MTMPLGALDSPPPVVLAPGGVSAPGAGRGADHGPVDASPPVVHGAGVAPSPDAVRAAAAEANRAIAAFTHALQFEVDPGTRTVVVRLIDTQDGRVLRQIPTQEMLDIARSLARMQTMLAHGEA